MARRRRDRGAACRTAPCRGLRLVVGAPRLRIGNARSACLDHSAVRLCLAAQEELDRVAVLADAARQLEVRARTAKPLILTDDAIPATALGLRRHHEDAALVLRDGLRGRDLQTPLPPSVRS